MGFLKDKKILVTGICNERSIALGIAKSLYKQKAQLSLVCQNKKIINKIKNLIHSMDIKSIFFCDVSDDENIKELFFNLKKIWNKFDGFIHAIAYCPKEKMYKDFVENSTKESFNLTHQISSYSFLSMARESKHMLNQSSSLITLSYLGSQRVLSNYGMMGLAKSSLEANVRYIAYSLGKKNIRVNGISCGPIKTISSYQIKNFCKTRKYHKSVSLIKNYITSNQIGNVAAFLCSDLSIGITGSIIYVDNGFNINIPNGII
ncbi:enoyl-ACP reductase FabI [Buchnera aphidicola]|uniref:Enoyl-[acyl-carrier-protein] reductase [NADH] n=1 Tax=Buchnera aphidicola (Aphis gossypii) TaxID=98785 RepID=A0A5J6ZBU0_9GAMM|nr:enoyl-ACP reductase [Buchnera aphidicola]QFQ32098.1 enoyl-ACP reductase [Buchnera aphidicola (Aphis gossypii)]UPT14624.1 enoyl-ACP reductase [Buchnera aphidicola (Aphis gossypii)]